MLVDKQHFAIHFVREAEVTLQLFVDLKLPRDLLLSCTVSTYITAMPSSERLDNQCAFLTD